MPLPFTRGTISALAYGLFGGKTVTASYLVVAGGGSGGAGGGGVGGGGGGAGGFLTGTTSLNATLSYTVTVGAGAPGNIWAAPPNSGSNSVFNSTTATGGGGGGSDGNTNTGANGGSGGGGGGRNGSGGTGTVGQGKDGGAGLLAASAYGGGGGGGATSAGGSASSSVGGNGGAGTASSISGSSVTYAGGGGGGVRTGTQGTGGSGGGGDGAAGSGGGSGNPGTANTGGGGGGSAGNVSATPVGGNGGSGIVIISYTGPQQFGGGVVTSSGGNTIHTFTTSGTLSPLSSLTSSYLIVAGGGGGGADVGGGGGAGGMQTGSSLTIDTNSVYVVTVGAGGAGSTTTANGVSGSNSSFSIVSTSSVGGGGGASTTNAAGSSGGSGGGGTRVSGAGGTGTAGQGNNGGSGSSTSGANVSAAGGGGGASAVGANATGGVGGNGGAGLASSISGSSVTYAGGGGGRCDGSGTQGTGGSGGGGNASTTGTAGTANTGGGGGGGSTAGGAGGSGIVIISYPGSAAQMAGGTITVAGGNVIHTFTSSGFLTPIVTLNKSLRFRASASAYLNRTLTTPTDNKKWTISAWVKIGALNTNNRIFSSGLSGTTYSTPICFVTGDTLDWLEYSSSTIVGRRTTTQVFRDPSAWYHIVCVYDSANATAANRMLVYVNGVQVTSFSSSTNPSLNANSVTNSAIGHQLGNIYAGSYTQYFDGYLADVNFIDGQALTPNAFGTMNDLGVWQPIRYGGSYGTNGFYLPFTNTTSTTTLGYDFSPNGNNWTTNNISLTSGVTYDSMTDVPTNTSATAANYCVLNPLDMDSGNTVANGNLQVTTSSGGQGFQRATMYVSSGKWYWEVLISSITGNASIGIAGANTVANTSNYIGATADSYGYFGSNGNKSNNGSSSAYGASYTNNDVIGVALDMDAGTLTFYKNNSSQGTAFTGLSGSFAPAVSDISNSSSSVFIANFGQRPFAYTPPSGFVALNTFNLPTPTIGATASSQAGKYFNAVLYTGNGSTQSVTGVGFQPDFTWIKERDAIEDHFIFDAVRGATKYIRSNTTDAEGTLANYLTSFDSNGFSLGNGGGVNGTSDLYVAWNWKANGTGVTNTAGTITSTVSANTTAGFSIVTYTGTGANATVGHGLGVAPRMVIVKNRTTAGTSWAVYTSTTGATNYLRLNSTIASTAGSSFWNNTAPTSTVFSIGTDSDVNANTNNIVAYCFAEVAGYSKFGSYTGNGSTDGPFIFTGFRPKFLLVKRTDVGGSWYIWDTSRNSASGGNVMGYQLYPDLANAESGSGTDFDFLANGFKTRGNYTDINGNGGTYIYMAFAEEPFKYANAR